MKPLPGVLCAECELPYRHHDDFERCLFAAQEVYFREFTLEEWYARSHRRFLEKNPGSTMTLTEWRHP